MKESLVIINVYWLSKYGCHNFKILVQWRVLFDPQRISESYDS